MQLSTFRHIRIGNRKKGNCSNRNTTHLLMLKAPNVKLVGRLSRAGKRFLTLIIENESVGWRDTLESKVQLKTVRKVRIAIPQDLSDASSRRIMRMKSSPIHHLAFTSRAQNHKRANTNGRSLGVYDAKVFGNNAGRFRMQRKEIMWARQEVPLQILVVHTLDL